MCEEQKLMTIVIIPHKSTAFFTEAGKSFFRVYIGKKCLHFRGGDVFDYNSLGEEGGKIIFDSMIKSSLRMF